MRSQCAGEISYYWSLSHRIKAVDKGILHRSSPRKHLFFKSFRGTLGARIHRYERPIDQPCLPGGKDKWDMLRIGVTFPPRP